MSIEVNDKIDQVRIDSTRALIEYLRPIARNHGADYERQNFNITDPVITREFVHRAIALEASEPLLGKPIPLVQPVITTVMAHSAFATGVLSREAIREVVLLAILRMVASPEPHTRHPETLRLDQLRIHGFQNTFQSQIVLGILVSLAHSLDRTARATASPTISPRSQSYSPLSSPRDIGDGHFPHSPPNLTMLSSSPTSVGAISPGYQGPEPVPLSPRPFETTGMWLKRLHAKFVHLLSSPEVKMAYLKHFLRQELIARSTSTTDAAANEQKINSIVNTFDAACNPQHLLYKTIQTRILQFLWWVLTDSVDEISTIVNGEAVPVSFLAQDCASIGIAIKKMAALNFTAFSDIYQQIIEQLARAS
jgi:hypothetical protein